MANVEDRKEQKLAPLAASKSTPAPEMRLDDPSLDLNEVDERDEDLDFVRVSNKLPRLLHLPDKIHTSSGPEGPRIIGVGTGKSLMPGGNNVPRAMWEALKGQKYGEQLDPRIDKAHARRLRGAPGHRTVRDWIRMGYLVEEGDVAEPEGPEAPPTLVGYGVAAAQALVEGVDDAQVLARWLKAEVRPDVQAALRKRLQAVGVGGKQN